MNSYQVLIRLIGADETMYANYADAMQWLDDTNVLEMIVEKFGSSVCIFPPLCSNTTATKLILVIFSIITYFLVWYHMGYTELFYNWSNGWSFS